MHYLIGGLVGAVAVLGLTLIFAFSSFGGRGREISELKTDHEWISHRLDQIGFDVKQNGEKLDSLLKIAKRNVGEK